MLPPNDDTQRRIDTYHAWGVCGFLLLAIGLIYGQTLGHVLLEHDDKDFVWGNPLIAPGLTAAGIKAAIVGSQFAEWYPLATMSHMLDCQLFGLHAWGHHLVNVLLHAATSVALFLVLWRMTGELWPSAFVAAIFAVHPQHVESVAWVAERRDMLSGLFFVLTLGAWLGYVRHGRSLGRYLPVTVLFALGLLSKSMIVTLPPLLLLLDFWPLARFGHAADVPDWAQTVHRPGPLRLVLEKLPLFALAVGDCVMTLWTHNPYGGTPLPWSERIGNAAVSSVTYLVQFFYPVDLAVFYPYPPAGTPVGKAAGAVAILAVASIAAVIWRRRCPYLFVGWFWFLGMLIPVLGFVKISDHAMANRYMYLPGIGLYIALAWGATRLALRLPAGRSVLGTCAGLVIAALVACAVWQTSIWRNDETLFRRSLACTIENGNAEFGLANALAQQGRFDEAIAHYRRALATTSIERILFNAHLNLGVALNVRGKLDEATDQLRQALAIKPDSYDAHVDLGGVLMRRKRFDESIQQFRRAIEIDPLRVNAHGALGQTLRQDGQVAEARAEFEKAVAADPRNPTAQTDLGQALVDQGNIDEAIPHFEAALTLAPRFLRAHLGLAQALAARRQTNEAIAHYRQALAIDPSNPTARQNLEKLLHDNAYLLTP